MKLTKIYVGANSQTKCVDIEKLEIALSSVVDSYSITKVSNVCRGMTEDMRVIEILHPDDLSYNGFAKFLKETLEQDSILVTTQLIEANFI